jgi:hypothetical protein
VVPQRRRVINGHKALPGNTTTPNPGREPSHDEDGILRPGEGIARGGNTQTGIQRGRGGRGGGRGSGRQTQAQRLAVLERQMATAVPAQAPSATQAPPASQQTPWLPSSLPNMPWPLQHPSPQGFNRPYDMPGPQGPSFHPGSQISIHGSAPVYGSMLASHQHIQMAQRAPKQPNTAMYLLPPPSNQAQAQDSIFRPWVPPGGRIN